MNVRTPFGLLLAASLAVLPGCTSEKQDASADETVHVRPGQQSGSPQPEAAAKQAWRSQEAPLLTEHIQITFRNKFLKAGEQYFSPDGSWIIFQATEVPADVNTPPSPHYSMYVARLNRNAAGEVTGVDEPILISPAGSANTCGWFHPTQPARVIYGSTIGEPNRDERSGFQVGTNRYRWAFPAEMEIVTQTIRPMVLSLGQAQRSQCGTDYLASPLFARDGYDAECSFDPTGRFVLYANVDPSKTLPDGRADADIYLYDTKTQRHLPLVVAPGYDGGPFFSPDGKSICYRSDRRLNDLLQLYIADLKFETDADGNAVPVGIEREYQVTDNESVNWAPYWHPTGSFLVYGTSEVGHSNYEVFAVEIDRSKLAEGKNKELRRRRLTFAPGADVLPTFSSDGSLMMWTSQRGPMVEGETKGSSQIWIARWNGMPFSKEWKE
jgi:TolB protein